MQNGNLTSIFLDSDFVKILYSYKKNFCWLSGSFEKGIYKYTNCKNFLFHLTDLQNVNITLRILFRPEAKSLPGIFTSLGEDYDERVLPSITTEVLKAIVVYEFFFLLTHLTQDPTFLVQNPFIQYHCLH